MLAEPIILLASVVAAVICVVKSRKRHDEKFFSKYINEAWHIGTSQEKSEIFIISIAEKDILLLKQRSSGYNI